MNQQNQHGKKVNVLFLFALPAIIVFDVIYYLLTRSSCFNCTNIGEFMKNSSLSVFLLSETYNFFKNKA